MSLIVTIPPCEKCEASKAFGAARIAVLEADNEKLLEWARAAYAMERYRNNELPMNEQEEIRCRYERACQAVRPLLGEKK